MLLVKRRTWSVIASILAVVMPVILGAQARVIEVVSSDGQPVAYANVSVQGGLTQITDEKGEVSIGAGKHQTLTLDIKRIEHVVWVERDPRQSNVRDAGRSAQVRAGAYRIHRPELPYDNCH